MTASPAAAPRADTARFRPKSPPPSPVQNAMSVDVEDYFQVQAFAGRFGRDVWDRQPCRVERNTDKVLEIFDTAGIKATFFTLGWVAERYPALIRRIVAEGHELASHGYAHFRADEQSPETFRADIARTKAVLEDAGGAEVIGYRAATFSIGRGNLWALDVLAEEGYRYSSSIYPVHHDFYGMPEAPRSAFYPTGEPGFEEYPVTTLRLGSLNLPIGGGGYFRLLPYPVSRWAMARVNRRDRLPCIFYFHPWEVDPGQPRQHGLGLKTRVRHYTGIRRMEAKLKRLCRDFRWNRMDRVFCPQ